MGLKESVFNVSARCGDETLLFSTLTGELVTLQPGAGDLAQHPAAELLTRRGFLVDESLSVRDEYEAFFRRRSQLSADVYIIFTSTTTCNLACNYCFQNRIKRAPMEPAVLEQSLRWLEERVRETEAKGVGLTLFGGEPLLAPDLGRQLLEGVRRLCDSLDVAMRPVLLTTNGLHDDRGVLGTLAEAGVSRVQVTLDGAEAVNDSRRLRRKGRGRDPGVYETVLENLKIYAHFFDLTVKLNFDRSTVDSVPAMLDDLFERAGLRQGEFHVKAEPIAIWKRNSSPATSARPIYDPSQREMAHAFADLIRRCEERGVPIDLSAMFPTPCMVSQPNSFMLEPDGSLRSCISAYGLDEFGVGNVFEGLDRRNSRTRYATDPETVDLQQCLDRECPYLPVCDGGCKYEVHLQGLPSRTMQCKLDYFTEAVPVLMRHRRRTNRRMLALDRPPKGNR